MRETLIKSFHRTYHRNFPASNARSGNIFLFTPPLHLLRIEKFPSRNRAYFVGLNWTLEAVFNLAAIGIIALAVIWFLLAIYRGNRYRYFTYLLLAEALYLVRFAFITLGIIFTDVWLAKLGWAVLAIQLVLLITAADSLYRDSVSTAQLTIFSILATVAVVLLFTTPDAASLQLLPDGTGTIVVNPVIIEIVLPPFFIAILIYFIILGKLIHQAPNNLKQFARWGLAGYCFMTFVPAIIVASRLSLVWLGGAQIVSGIGVLLMNITFVKHPKLNFILSFKVLRLTVLDTDSGLALFTHTWQSGESLINEELFSGMLQGVSLIVKEATSGNVQELKLDEGIIIIQRVQHSNIACILVASKASQTLRDGLRVFATKIYDLFGVTLLKPNNTDRFTAVTALINECFPFVS